VILGSGALGVRPLSDPIELPPAIIVIPATPLPGFGGQPLASLWGLNRLPTDMLSANVGVYLAYEFSAVTSGAFLRRQPNGAAMHNQQAGCITVDPDLGVFVVSESL
jgi:hypothetical protein